MPPDRLLSAKPGPPSSARNARSARDLVEANGFEPMTSGLQSRRSPN